MEPVIGGSYLLSSKGLIVVCHQMERYDQRYQSWKLMMTAP